MTAGGGSAIGRTGVAPLDFGFAVGGRRLEEMANLVVVFEQELDLGTQRRVLAARNRPDRPTAPDRLSVRGPR